MVNLSEGGEFAAGDSVTEAVIAIWTELKMLIFPLGESANRRFFAARDGIELSFEVEDEGVGKRLDVFDDGVGGSEGGELR